MTACPKCGNAMAEAKRYHALPVMKDDLSGMNLNGFIPIHVYECEKCRYIEIYGSGKP